MSVQADTAAPAKELTRSLAELVAERAAERPDAVAIEDRERLLTYAELDTAGAAIAAGLRAAGVEDEEPVGVCLPRSWQAVCALLGALRAGAAYMPVNPAHPAHRQRQLLELAGARLALSSEAHGQRLPEHVTSLDAETLALTRSEVAGPVSGGDRLAYVLFTSGSTGFPKGVEVTHRNLVHLLRSSVDLVALPNDTALHGAPLEFDMSALEIWGALVNGARLVLAPPGLPDPACLGRLIAERGITKIIVSPGMLNELVHSALPDLGGLRLIVAGGDVLSPETVAKLRSAHPSIRLLNGYGPTEATIAATSFEVIEADGEPVPIGRPHPGYRLYVLDEVGEPVPEGEPGELWIGGPGVARGYRNDPGQTAERFQKNPFDPGSVYRTGDRVRVRADGELLFLGRLDEQVKVGGQRIEPGEVERALASHAGVLEAVVAAREDVPGHKRLVAYVAVDPDGAPPASELHEHLASLLPPFMVPGSIVSLERLPRNERGKVDRSALPAPRREAGDDAGDDPRLAPVARTMAEVLRLDLVGPHEDFFDLGGTSLLALQLTGRLRAQLGARIDIGAVFEERTASSLADRIARSRDEALEMPPLLPTPRKAAAPVSGAQRRTWLFGRMHPDSIAFQFAAIFRLDGQLDEDALRGALGELLERHEILRTSFEERAGEPVQVIHAECRPDLESVDLRGQGHDAWPRLIRSRVRVRVDPSEAPLVHWTLARVGEESWTLLQVEHHLIHDGWSFAVLAGELAELYSARVEGRRPDLPEPAVQFQDYARWERDAHRGPEVARQVEHWARTLNPSPPTLELPGARTRPSRESFAGGSVRLSVDGGLDRGLRSLARESRTTLFMVTLAAFLAQLQRYSGQDDLQVGSGLANRRDPAAERLIGMAVNTAVLRCDLGDDPTVRELLERVRRVAVDAYANADAPFEAVVDAVGARREPGRSPLIQTLFSFHDAPRDAEHWAGLAMRPVEGIPNGTAKADLNVIGIAKADGGLNFIWEHSDLLADAAANRLAGHHLQLLEQFVANPDARLSELDLLSGEERAELETWSAGPGSYDREGTVHGLVEERARRSPGAVAVVEGSTHLTYGELVERAHAVAASLRERGVERGDRVGVLLRRSAETPVAQLGVLAAGAAYVPLDPLHPPARIARSLADAGVSVALTETELRRRLPVGVAPLEVSEAAAAEPAAAVDADPEDLAYVIYTSGSTGEPKGVEVTHRNVVRLVDEPDYAELGPGTTMLHAASPAFDASTLEIWGPLAGGGTIACLGEQPSPDAVAAAIERDGVTTLWLTAGLFHELVDRRPESLSGVRQLLAGGDVLSPDHVRRALDALPPDGRLTNGYGPTETTTFAATHELCPGDPVEAPVPIGRSIQGTSCHVLDGDGRELPVGVVGELAIGGDGVARGYRGDPDLTAARFRPDPDRPAGRRYLTGDRVRRRPDGALEFVGRADRQVKVRGFRVEPAEVESALRAHPALADVAVAPFERAPGDLAIAAYVVAAPGSAAPGPADLRAHAAAQLPAAMVPAAWIALPELPLTPNGKLDRERLPAPADHHLVRADGAARPRNGTERRVVACFEDVLGVEPVGVEDDFFALGGHSLLAVTLFGELERIGGHRLPLSTIFEASTPRALAASLGTDAPASRWDNLVALKPSGSRPPLFAIAAGDGNIVGFGPLARRMPAEQPFYALQPSGLDGRQPLDQGIEAMAARYLEALRRVQPSGPYLLAGRCNGTTVAFAMAQRLRAEGEDVPLLVSLDSDPPPAKPRELARGIPYDPIMERAMLRAREAGEKVPNPGEPGGAAQLAEWLREPLGPGISRYLHEFWHWRRDLREAWPDPLGADAAELAWFAWSHAREELVPALLLAPPVGYRTPAGVVWDWAMAAAWDELTERPADPLSATGWHEFRACLTEPLAGGRLNRYLLGAWSRPDLREAFPQPLEESADALCAWAWLHGTEQSLVRDLLPSPPWPLSRRRRIDLALRPARAAAASARARLARRSRRLALEARLKAIEQLERRLPRPLPGATERTIHRSLAAARRARADYRADSWPGQVVLIVSAELEDKPNYLGWEARALGGVERHHIPYGHVEMLREPGVASLARCLEERIDEALAG